MTATVYDALIGTGNNVRQVVSTDYSPNARIEAGRVSAGVDPSALFLTEARPTARIQSGDLAGVLALLSVTAGLDVAGENIDLPYQFRAAGSTFAGNLSHSVLRGTNGLVVPQSASVNQGDVASLIDLMVHFESDGFTAPVAQVDDLTLTAQAFNALFGLGPAVLDSATVAGVIGHTVNFGLTVEPEMTDGAVYPVTHFITERNPSIDLRFRDFDSLAAAATIASAMTTLVVYHRKRAEGGTYVANGTGAHVAFSFGAGITSVQNVTGQGTQPAIPTLRCFGELLSVSSTATIS